MKLKPSKQLDGTDTSLQLPDCFKSVHQVHDQFGSQTNDILVLLNDGTHHKFNLVLLCLARTEELAAFAVKAGLKEHQHPKGLRDLSELIKQAKKTPVYLATHEGLHVVQYGNKTFKFFVWRDEFYMLDQKKPAIKILLDTGIRSGENTSGSLLDWQNEFDKFLVKNPYLVVVVCAAITAFLGRAFNLPLLVLILVGGSSLGKTTLEKVGQSLVTSGEKIESFTGTSKGMVTYLSSRHDQPVFIDELRQAAAPSDIIALIFDLANGASRKTSSATQVCLQTPPLTCGVILANETNLLELVSGTRVRITEGISARCFEMHMEGPHGAFHTLQDGMTAKETSEFLQRASTKFYGSFATALVKGAAKHASKIELLIANNHAQIEAELKAGLTINDPVTNRLVRGMAAWACAGLVAARLKLLNIDKKTVLAAIRLVLEEHLQRNTHGTHSVADKVISATRTIIDRNMSKFSSFATFSTSENSGIYGYRRLNDKDDLFLMLPNVFEALVGQQFGTDASARFLKEAGFLKCNSAGYQYQCRMPGESKNRKRFYAIYGSIRFDGQ